MRKAQLSEKTSLVVSLDDYNPNNIALAHRLKEIGVDALFYIEVMTQEARQQVKDLYEMGFEIGSHTMSHPPDMKLLTYAQQLYEIKMSKEVIEEITGVECTSFAYPRGRYNDDTIKSVQESGYKDARTTEILKLSHRDPFRMPATIHVYSGRTEYSGRPWEVMAQAYFNKAMADGGVFHIWGHTKEMAAHNETDKFLNFLEAIKNPHAN